MSGHAALAVAMHPAKNLGRLVLTDDQADALQRIVLAAERGEVHLLTGFAGTGKTTLVQQVVLALVERRKRVVVTAPTHKAVAVLASKMAHDCLEAVSCVTIHRLLGLRPAADGPRTVMRRDARAKAVTADVVVIDECSMVDAELLGWTKRLLKHCFVLFVGDPAQLPPVGEAASLTFAIKARSHLGTIVRQAADNPILAAAHVIRSSQGGPLDWSWCRDARSGQQGVFVPAHPQRWMRQAFTSSRFRADNDEFRYLCWTNARVSQVNGQVRRWIYGGETATPFMPGERVLMRSPVIRDNAVLLATNEEVEVVGIEPSPFHAKFEERRNLGAWVAEVASWKVSLRSFAGVKADVHMAADPAALASVEGRLLREARTVPERWQDRFGFQQSMARMQAIYAMTVHTSQGSTFGHAFVDLADIGRRAASNLLETQQLLYVAATRPSQALILVNAAGAA